MNNAKSQITGWLGSGIPIPGLRKNDSQATETVEPVPAEVVESSEPKPEPKDDDDNSRYIRYGVGRWNESQCGFIFKFLFYISFLSLLLSLLFDFTKNGFTC